MVHVIQDIYSDSTLYMQLPHDTSADSIKGSSVTRMTHITDVTIMYNMDIVGVTCVLLSAASYILWQHIHSSFFTQIIMQHKHSQAALNFNSYFRPIWLCIMQ